MRRAKMIRRDVKSPGWREHRDRQSAEPGEARMWPARMPYQPTVNDLHQNGRRFPPNYLHESWMDYLYWDSVLEP
jgi:hypothetical protein